MKSVKELSFGSVYRRKSDGRWIAAITIGYDGQGKQKRRTVSAKTQPEVLRRRNQLFLELKNSLTTQPDVTVETWAEKWLATTALESYTPGNLANHQSRVKHYILPVLGKYKLRELGADEVEELDAATEHLAGSTRQGIRSTLSMMLADAVRKKKLDENPCKQVARPKALYKQRLALDVETARRIILHSAQVGDPLATLWASYLFLGGRKNELLGLEWSRLDLDSGLAELTWAMAEVPWQHGPRCKCGEGVKAAACPSRVHKLPKGYEAREMHGGLMWQRLKTDASHRWTPLPAPLIAGLRHHQRTTPSNRWGLVWTGPKGGPLRPDRALILWKAALKRAGVPPVDIHTSRHTTASLLRESGVPEEVIAKMLGQAQINTTRRYIHTNDTQVRKAMRTFEGFMELPTGVESSEEGDGFWQ